MNQKRQPAGIPVGGQFSANEHDEASVLVPDGDYESCDAADIYPGDLIDMTRTVNEYLDDPERGGNEDNESIADLVKMRGLYRVVSVDDDGDGISMVTMSSLDRPSEEDVSWVAVEGVCTFDYVSDRAEGISRDLLDPNGDESAILRDFPDRWRNEARNAIRAAIQNDTGESAGLIAGRMVDPNGDESAILRDLPDSYKTDARKALISAVKTARKP